MTFKPVILLVDDDPDTRSLVRDAILSVREDVDVREVSSAPEAFDYLRQCEANSQPPRPDLIYLDIEMAGPTGQTVLLVVKGQPRLRDIPVVMLTGVDDDAQKTQAAVNGANSYVLKPHNPMDMLKTVRVTTDYWLNLDQLCKA